MKFTPLTRSRSAGPPSPRLRGEGRSEGREGLPRRRGNPMRLGHQLRQRLVERDADRHRIGAGASNAEHLQCRRNLRLASASADALGEIEDGVDPAFRKLVEHRRAPAEAHGFVSGFAESGFERLDRLDRVEFLEAVSCRSFRLEVVGQTDAQAMVMILARVS